jgi:hypothetical protein
LNKYKQALRQILAIIATVEPPTMGPRNEAIWEVTEQLADPEVAYVTRHTGGPIDTRLLPPWLIAALKIDPKTGLPA